MVKLFEECTEYHSLSSGISLPLADSCLKGVEINSKTGEVHDKGIVHGINQLMYGLPVLLNRNLKYNLIDHLDDVYPFIICPILATTAELRVLNSDFSMKNLSQAKDLEEISKTVPFVKYYTTSYPSFEEHCKNVFKKLSNYSNKERRKYYESLKKNDISNLEEALSKPFYRSPHTLLSTLEYGAGNDAFNETMICNFKHLPLLIKKVKENIRLLGDTLEKLGSS